MKKHLIFLLLCINFVDLQFAFNPHEGFGKKHFIIGYTPHQDENGATEKKPQIIKKDKTPSTYSYFTSVHDVRKELDARLAKAEKSIKIATFALTDTRIAEQLIKAHQNNITVTIVTDKEKMRDRYSKTGKLAQNGIPVYYYTPELNPNARQKKAKDALMHHKFIIIDDKT